MLAGVVKSKDESIVCSRGDSREFAPEDLVAAFVIVVLEVSQLPGVGKRLDTASDDRAVVVGITAPALALWSKSKSIMLLALLLWLTWVSEASCLRPARLLAKYSQVTFRLTQREHAGFSLEHRTLDVAQPKQQSRNLGEAVDVFARGPGTCEGVEEPEGVKSFSVAIIHC